MTLTIDLTPEMEERLKAAAARRGVAPEALALQALDDLVGREAPMSPAELVAYWEREGILGMWTDREDITDSSEFARELRRGAEARE